MTGSAWSVKKRESQTQAEAPVTFQHAGPEAIAKSRDRKSAVGRSGLSHAEEPRRALRGARGGVGRLRREAGWTLPACREKKRLPADIELAGARSPS